MFYEHSKVPQTCGFVSIEGVWLSKISSVKVESKNIETIRQNGAAKE
jgi:hypothetical protein